jgi:hypothetical protein
MNKTKQNIQQYFALRTTVLFDPEAAFRRYFAFYRILFIKQRPLEIDSHTAISIMLALRPRFRSHTGDEGT